MLFRSPTSIQPSILAAADGIPADDPHSANLYRVHWYNDEQRNGLTDVPGHLVLDETLTGVAAPIIVVLGGRFPLIGAHKVLPAYACLVTRIVSGQFDPTRQIGRAACKGKSVDLGGRRIIKKNTDDTDTCSHVQH